ncbi:hypothetical protein HAX54_038434, partial [Datura stramonium]|nr:hypothetical protein [Datura stramonium]
MAALELELSTFNPYLSNKETMGAFWKEEETMWIKSVNLATPSWVMTTYCRSMDIMSSNDDAKYMYSPYSYYITCPFNVQ